MSMALKKPRRLICHKNTKEEILSKNKKQKTNDDKLTSNRVYPSFFSIQGFCDDRFMMSVYRDHLTV